MPPDILDPTPAESLLALAGPVARWGAVLLAFFLAARFAIDLIDYLRVRKGLSGVPTAPGCDIFTGHALSLLMANTPWERMLDWLIDLEPIVRWRLFLRNCLMVRHPEILRRIFQTNFRAYEKDLASYEPFLAILGTGLVTSNGRLWQHQRQLMLPALRVEILDYIVGKAKEVVDLLSAKLEGLRGTGRAIDMEEEFRRITLQVIGAACLDLPPEECDRVFPELYLKAMDECNRRVLGFWRKYLPTPGFFHFRNTVRRLDEYLLNICRERWRLRQQGIKDKHGDILDRILGAIEENGEKWDTKLETQLCYEMKTFLLAGHETSAEMLTWCLSELLNNQEYLNRVRDEANEVFGTKEECPKRAAVDGMTFTLAVLKETLRRHTLVPVITRVFVGEEDELMGQKIPKGTMVALHLEGTHMLWKDPLTYDPNRFLPGGEYESFDEVLRPFMFVPFIQGPRNCLGQHLALLEARVVLSLLLKRFQFTQLQPGVPKKGRQVPVCTEAGLHVYVN